MDSSRNLTERLFARSFRVSVEAGVRWGDLLNTAPSTTVLMGEGLIGFAPKTKTRGGSLKADLGDQAITHFLTKSGYVKGMKCSKMILVILAGTIG